MKSSLIGKPNPFRRLWGKGQRPFLLCTAVIGAEIIPMLVSSRVSLCRKLAAMIPLCPLLLWSTRIHARILSDVSPPPEPTHTSTILTPLWHDRGYSPSTSPHQERSVQNTSLSSSIQSGLLHDLSTSPPSNSSSPQKNLASLQWSGGYGWGHARSSLSSPKKIHPALAADESSEKSADVGGLHEIMRKGTHMYKYTSDEHKQRRKHERLFKVKGAGHDAVLKWTAHMWTLDKKARSIKIDDIEVPLLPFSMPNTRRIHARELTLLQK